MMKKQRQFRVPKTEVGKIEYDISKVMKRMQRKDVNNWTARYIEDLAKLGKGLKMAKKQITQKQHIIEVKESDGSLTTDTERIHQQQKNFMRDFTTPLLYSQTIIKGRKFLLFQMSPLGGIVVLARFVFSCQCLRL